MKCSSSILSSGLLAASVWIPGSESFHSVSFVARTKLNSRIPNKSVTTINNNNNNIPTTRLQNSSMKNSSSDDMVSAQEAEAKTICPLLPPPEDVHATFEAAMG